MVRRALFSISSVALMLVSAGCGSEGICRTTTTARGGLTTRVDFSQCWDGSERTVACEPPFGDYTPITCTCRLGGNETGTFTRDAPLVITDDASAAQLAPINEGCGWALRAR